MGPTVHGQEGCQETREDFPVPSPHLSPNPVQTDPHWALGGLQLPNPIPGSTPSHLKQAKHRQVCEGGDRNKSMTLERGASLQSPFLGGAPSLACPTAANPTCSTCHPSSHLLEILRVAEFLDSDRQEVAGDISDDHIGAG